MSKIGRNRLSKSPDTRNHGGLFLQLRSPIVALPRVLAKTSTRKSNDSPSVNHHRSRSYTGRNSNAKNGKTKTNNLKNAPSVKTNERDRSKPKAATAGPKVTYKTPPSSAKEIPGNRCWSPVTQTTKGTNKQLDARSRSSFKSAPSSTDPHLKQNRGVTSRLKPTLYAFSDDSRTNKGSTGVSSRQTSTSSMKPKMCLDLKVLYEDREKHLQKMRLVLGQQESALKEARDKQDSSISEAHNIEHNVCKKNNLLSASDTTGGFLNEDFHTNRLSVGREQVFAMQNLTLNHQDQDHLHEIQTSLISLCERALNKRQQLFLWLQSLITDNSSSTRTEEFALKLNELMMESDELATSYNETMSQLNRGVGNTLQLLQKAYLDRDLMKDNLSAEISILSQENAEIKNQFEAAVNERDALEQKLTDEKSQRHVLQEQLHFLDKKLKFKDDTLKDVFTKFEKLSEDSAVMVKKVSLVEEERNTMKQDYDKKLEVNSKSLEFNLEKIDTFRKYASDLEEIITNQRQELNALDDASNTIRELETEKSDYKEKYEKSEIMLKSMEGRIKGLETLIKTFQDSLAQQTNCRHEMEIELLKSAELMKSLQDQNQMYPGQKQQLSGKSLSEKSVATDENEALTTKLTTYETSMGEKDKKIEKYEDMFFKLHNMITQLKTSDVTAIDCGFMPELKEVVVDQRMKLAEIIEQNGVLSFHILQKDKLIEKYRQSITEQASLLQMKDEIIQMLTNKDAEPREVMQFLHQDVEKVENEMKKMSIKNIESNKDFNVAPKRRKRQETNRLQINRRLQETSEEIELKISEFDNENSDTSFTNLGQSWQSQQHQNKRSKRKYQEKIEDLERVLTEAQNTDRAPQRINFKKLFSSTTTNSEKAIYQLEAQTCMKTAPHALEQKQSADSMLINLLSGGNFRKFTP